MFGSYLYHVVAAKIGAGGEMEGERRMRVDVREREWERGRKSIRMGKGERR